MTPEDASAVMGRIDELWPKADWSPATQEIVFQKLKTIPLSLKVALAALTRVRLASQYPNVEPGEIMPALLAESQSAAHTPRFEPYRAPEDKHAGARAVRAIADGTAPNHSERARAACRAELDRAAKAGEEPKPSRVIGALASNIGNLPKGTA